MLIRRETNAGANGLLTVYRPCTIDEFVGSNSLKKLLKNYLTTDTLPHSILFSGPAGCGKTTLARVVALHLNCENLQNGAACLACDSCKSILNSNNFDVMEINVATNSGKAAVDDIVNTLATAPFRSKYKVLIFDECHRLSEAAKAVLLKHMEDCYSHVYLIFCTNEPDKLVSKNEEEKGNPFIDRCEQLDLKTVSQEEIYNMLENVCQFEGANYNKEVLDYITEVVKGVPRKALNSLGKILTEGSWQMSNVRELLEDILVDDNDTEIINLCKSLLAKDFGLSCALFEVLAKKYPVESIRISVCGYFVGCLKRSKGKGGLSLSNAITQLTTPIYLTGKPAEYIFYNIMFKVVTLLGGN
ncbi:AAA family ATPase [bacterium]|nr:AAA family ATPase [bacterium]